MQGDAMYHECLASLVFLLCLFFLRLGHCWQPLVPRQPCSVPISQIFESSLIIIQALLPHICQHLPICVSLDRPLLADVALMLLLLQHDLTPPIEAAGGIQRAQVIRAACLNYVACILQTRQC